MDSAAAALQRFGDVAVDLSCELGRRQLTLGEVRRLEAGDVVELGKLAGEAMEIRLNGLPFAEGEIVVVTDVIAVRVTGLATVARGDEP
ncbi:MAG: FliM/FliN family flagellar motor switch protein [Gemmatimonadota bacterium]